MKEDYDGAEPSPTSVSVLNLLALAHLTGEESLARRVEQTLAGFGLRATRTGRAAPMLLAAISTYHMGVPQIVVVGVRHRTRPLHDVLRQHYLPNAVVFPAEPSHRDRFAAILPWTSSMTAAGDTAIYICRDFACERPVRSAAELEAALDRIVNRES